MTVTQRRSYEHEQQELEIQLDFWTRQQENTEDEEFWHYIEARRQVLNERLDKIRRKLEGVRW